MNSFQTVHIAVLEDDPLLLKFIAELLSQSGDKFAFPVQIHPFSTGEGLLDVLNSVRFDALVLDRKLSGVSGDDILAWVRLMAPPETVVIMVTSMTSSSEMANLFSLGADDYITKPFEPIELVARLWRLLRRSRKIEAPISNNIFSLYGLLFNRINLTICRQGLIFSCSAGEFALAEYLFKNVGVTLNRKQIFEAVWQRRSLDSSRALDAQIHRVRSKLGLTVENGFVLQPVYGVGYRLDVIGEPIEAI